MNKAATQATRRDTDPRMHDSGIESLGRYMYEATSKSIDQSMRQWVASHIRPYDIPPGGIPPLSAGYPIQWAPYN